VSILASIHGSHLTHLPREQFFFFSSLVPNPDNVMATKKAKKRGTKRKTMATRAKEMEVEETAGK
jgi:hypothetical protein